MGRVQILSESSSLGSMLVQFLHRGCKNFGQNSRTLTGETKGRRPAPAVQDQHAGLRIPAETDVQLVIFVPRPVVLAREFFSPHTSVWAGHADERYGIGDFH